MAVSTSSRSAVSDLMDFARREGYALGDRLPPIRELSATLELGRNAIRDGLLEAQTLGFVRIEPRRGVFIECLDSGNPVDGLGSTLEKALSQEEPNLFHLLGARLVVEVELAAEAARTRRPEDLLPLRQALEAVLAARGDRLAFIRADEAYHLAIARVAGNRVLFVFLQALWRLIAPAKLNVLLSTENLQVSDREHQELFQSIVAGDAEKARTTMRAHIGRGRDLLLAFVHTLPQAEPEAGDLESPSRSKTRTGGQTS